MAEAWHLGMLCSFDVESTGVDVENDRIVTACIAWIDGMGAGAPVIRNWLVDPGIEIPEEAAKVHGITTEIARAEGMSPAPVIAEITEELIRAADGQVPIVAFNACYDLTLLDRECRRNGTGPVGPVLDEAKALVVDPFVMDKALDPFRKGKRNLTAVAAHYGVKQDQAHSASGDAITAARVAWRIAARNPQVARMGGDRVARLAGQGPAGSGPVVRRLPAQARQAGRGRGRVLAVAAVGRGGGGLMKIRLHGTSEECAEAVTRLQGTFAVVSVSEQYPDRGASRLVRVYVEVRL